MQQQYGDTLIEEVEKLRKEVKELEIKLMSRNTKIEAYKAAMGQVTNLAFGLIASATIIILISNVKKK